MLLFLDSFNADSRIPLQESDPWNRITGEFLPDSNINSSNRNGEELLEIDDVIEGESEEIQNDSVHNDENGSENESVMQKCIAILSMYIIGKNALCGEYIPSEYGTEEDEDYVEICSDRT